MKKIIGWSLLIYLVYVLAMFWYLFYGADTSIPSALKGTAADPATFLNAKELMLSEEYSKIRNLLFFVNLPYDWLLYFFILVLGFSMKFSTWSKAISKLSLVQTAIYLFYLSLLVEALSYPLKWISYTLSKNYQITTQAFSGWMKDLVIGFWVDYAIMFLIVSVLFMLIRKSGKRWWFYAWLCSVPFSLFLMFFQPVVIDPLYNDFYPLKDKELETKILALASKAEIPAEHVYEVNMSEKTNALNAYVTGIGSNSRIVLWDTTLERLNDEEILFIMAHEMGHYVMKHIYVGIAGYLLMTLIGLFIIHKLLTYIVNRWGRLFKIDKISDLSMLPLFLLLVSVLSFTASPVENAVSRHQERAADTYAMELTHEQDAAIRTFQELTKAGLSQVNPPYLVKLLRYGHPTMLERITYLETYDQEEQK
ncbi:M48 family metallopeptidase [Litchfieldia salsa]|uniref:Zn-dependent protease with chaperone function n=1 Tax=Litchfieldia salsa TaxID=930152 RepID=A0A1H0UNY1_9BACI|nr:M48 family metallopeptidase [Litchfieldia salsa]SDP67780.1 Zn-dependent protease with chaperone function [Litchfieldia salsa]